MILHSPSQKKACCIGKSLKVLSRTGKDDLGLLDAQQELGGL